MPKKETLKVVVDEDGKHRIAWFDSPDVFTGLILGQGSFVNIVDEPEEPDDYEIWVSEKEAKDDSDGLEDEHGFYWDTESKVKKVLHNISSSVKKMSVNTPAKVK
jgi:hypothetical protein